MAVKISVEAVIENPQLVLAEESHILKSTTDVSSYAKPGASSVNYPSVAARVGQKKAITGVFDLVNNDFGDDKFDLSEKLGDFFSVNLHQEKQNVLDSLRIGTEQTLKAIARQAGLIMYDKMNLAAGTTTVPNATSAYDSVVEMVKSLGEKNVPLDGQIYLLPSQAFYAKMLKELKNHFRITADETGVVAEIAGAKILPPTNIKDSDLIGVGRVAKTMMYHKAGAVWAFQGETLMLETVKAGSSAVDYEISKLFGGKATQTGKLITALVEE